MKLGPGGRDRAPVKSKLPENPAPCTDPPLWFMSSRCWRCCSGAAPEWGRAAAAQVPPRADCQGRLCLCRAFSKPFSSFQSSC